MISIVFEVSCLQPSKHGLSNIIAKILGIFHRSPLPLIKLIVRVHIRMRALRELVKFDELRE